MDSNSRNYVVHGFGARTELVTTSENSREKGWSFFSRLLLNQFDITNTSKLLQ